MAKKKIDALSPLGARVALDFLDFLDSKEDAAATEELLSIPGFLSEFREAERQVAEGRGVPLSETGSTTRAGWSPSF